MDVIKRFVLPDEADFEQADFALALPEAAKVLFLYFTAESKVSIHVRMNPHDPRSARRFRIVTDDCPIDGSWDYVGSIGCVTPVFHLFERRS